MCFVSLKLWLFRLYQNRPSSYVFSVLIFLKNSQTLALSFCFMELRSKDLIPSSKYLAGCLFLAPVAYGHVLHFGHAVGGLRFGYRSSFSYPFVVGFRSVFYMGKLTGLISCFSCVLWVF